MDRFAGLCCCALLAVVVAAGLLSAAEPPLERFEPVAIQAAEPPEGGGPTWTLDQLEQLALASHPAVAQAEAEIRAAQGRWVQAGLLPNPRLGYTAEEMGDEGTAGQQGVSISQRVVTGGKRRLAREAACQEIVRLQQLLEVRRRQVATDVRVAFYELLGAERRVHLLEQLVELADRGVRAVEALLRAQEASRVDLLRARVEANATRLQFEEALRRREAARRRLAAAAAVDQLPSGSMAGDLEDAGPELTWDEAWRRVLAESPELAAAYAALQGARWRWRLERAARIPDVEVGVALTHNNATGEDLTGVDVALPLPLWDRNQGAIGAASAEAAAARQEVERLQVGLRDRLAAAYQQYATALQQARTYQTEILPDARSTLELVMEGYRNGEFAYLELLTAQRTYFQNSLDYVDVLVRLHTARALIDGLLLSGAAGR